MRFASIVAAALCLFALPLLVTPAEAAVVCTVNKTINRGSSILIDFTGSNSGSACNITIAVSTNTAAIHGTLTREPVGTSGRNRRIIYTNTDASAGYTTDSFIMDGDNFGDTIVVNISFNSPDLTTSMANSGATTQGATGYTFTGTATNSGAAPTNSTVTATFSTPSGVTATAINGTGWSCVLGTLSCTRSDSLAASSSYPAITVTASFASNATSPKVVSFSATGGFQAVTGNDSSSTSITVTSPVPTVTNVSPSSGPVAGGTSVTLTGTNFTGATSVTFGGTAASSFTVNSATQITASAPAHAAGAADIVVTTSAGTNSNTASDDFTYIAVAISPSSLSAATVGSVYSQTIGASGGTAPYTYAVTAGALPSGLTLASDGTLSGTPTAGGMFNFTVTATDSSSGAGPYSASQAYSLTVNTPTIAVSPTTLPAATTGSSYSQTISASGGTAAYTYAVTSGALPSGLSIASDGTLSGTPTAGGTYNFTVTATDSSTGTGPYTGSRAYSLTVNAPTVTVAPTTLSTGTTGSSYSQSVSASGGTAPYSYAITAGVHPAGLTLASDGMLSGTPTAGGVYTFTVTATDSSTGTGPYTGSRAYSLTINAPTVSISPTTLPGATDGASYSQSVSASGGTGPYSYAVTTGALPSGLSLASDGTISGVPTVYGSFNFTVTATDSSTGTGPFTGSRAYALTVAPQPIPTVAPVSATVAYGSSNNAVTLSITGSASSVAVGTQASHGTATASGTSISYTPQAGYAGPDSFTYTATSSGGTSTSAIVTITVTAPTLALTPATLPAAQQDAAYSQSLTTSNGTAPYSYAVTAGTLPTGLSLASDGTISGTPGVNGSFNFTVTATDSSTGTGPFTVSHAYVLTVAAPNVPVASGVSAAVAYGSSNNAITLSITGSVASVAVGIQASHGTATASGTSISYTPQAGYAGPDSFTYTATNDGGTSPSATVTITVAAPGLALTPSSLPSGEELAAYSQSLTTSGGLAPYSYSVTSGSLPAGLALASNGTLSGTPSVDGSFNFTVTATDSSTGTGPFTASQAYSLTIAPAPVPTANAVSATIAYGANAIAITPSISGASTGITVTQPAHGTASASGTSISYSPQSGYAGPDSFTYTVHNGGSASAPATISINVSSPVLAIGPNVLPAAPQGAPYSQQLSATGGTAPHAFSLASGALPQGLTLSTVGLLAGTATEFGNFSFRVQVTDASTGTGPFVATWDYMLVVDPQAPGTGAVSAAVAYGSGGNAIALVLTGSVTSVSVASAPTHGTATASGTSISYTPTPGYSGTDSFTYTAAGPGGTSGAATVSVTVGSATMTLDPASLPAGQQGVAYNQSLSASGGAAPYSYAVTAGTLPTGLSLASDGALAGTPGEHGVFGFTVTVTDGSAGAGPFTTSHDFSLSIAPPPAPVATDAPAATVSAATITSSQMVSVDLSSLVSGDFTDIQVASPPAHGQVTVSQVSFARAASISGRATAAALPRFQATYTPNAGFVGTDSFTFVAIGPGGTSSPATVEVTVVGNVPMAAAVTATTLVGQLATIDLTGAATEGPFTGAAVLSVSPAQSVTASLAEGGTPSARTYKLLVMPVGRFAGTAVVTYTLSNIYGTSAAATATITIASRPDPSQDPVVRALSDAQAEASRRFASAQIANFSRRAERLHGNGAGSRDQMDIRLVSGLPGYSRRYAVDPDISPELVAKMGYAAQPAPLGVADATPSEAGRSEGGPRKIGSIEVWTGGAILVGSQDAKSRRARMTISSSGLSAGADVKLGENVTLGIGGGYGNERSKVGGGAGRLDAESWTGAIYASFQPVDGAFLDSVLGIGDLDLKTRRIVSADNGIAVGSRNGSMIFGSFAAGIDRSSRRWNWSSYGRVEFLSSQLDAYAEQGAGLYNLSFGKRTARSFATVLGGRAETAVTTLIGVAMPRGRIDWRHEFNGGGTQVLDYADLSGLIYSIDNQGWSRDQIQLEIGSGLELSGGWNIGFDFGAAISSSSRLGTARVSANKQF